MAIRNAPPTVFGVILNAHIRPYVMFKPQLSARSVAEPHVTHTPPVDIQCMSTAKPAINQTVTVSRRASISDNQRQVSTSSLTVLHQERLCTSLGFDTLNQVFSLPLQFLVNKLRLNKGKRTE